MNFEERLQKAIDRGTDRRNQKADQAESAALTEEELKRLHSNHRLELSEHIEQCTEQVVNHFPGFQSETIYGERGWGVAISRDDPQTLSKFARKHSITYPLLSDPESQTIEAYGLRHSEPTNARVDGIARPGILLIDQEGHIRATLFKSGYKDRHTVEDILQAAKGLDSK